MRIQLLFILSVLSTTLLAQPVEIYSTYGEVAGDPTIRICSWNIFRFGAQHSPEMIDEMADILRSCHLISVQEVKDDEGATALRKALASTTRRSIGLIISARTGRTAGELESYALLWRLDKIQLLNAGGLSTSRKMVRQPHAAMFRANVKGKLAFDFVLMSIHTKPGELTQELEDLAHQIKHITRANPNEPDVIVVGDFNARPNMDRWNDNLAWHMPALEIPPSSSMIGRDGSNGILNDNLIWAPPTYEDYTGESGVIPFDSNGSSTDPRALSDHRPVWANFWSQFDHSD